MFDGMEKVMNGYGCRFGFGWVLWLGGLGVGVAEVAALNPIRVSIPSPPPPPVAATSPSNSGPDNSGRNSAGGNEPKTDMDKTRI
ncbi:hypothetical protein AAC387_Pa06g2218 [Persea americana]